MHKKKKADRKMKKVVQESMWIKNPENQVIHGVINVIHIKLQRRFFLHKGKTNSCFVEKA